MLNFNQNFLLDKEVWHLIVIIFLFFVYYEIVSFYLNIKLNVVEIFQ